MEQIWASYLSSFADSLHENEEMRIEIKMRMQATFKNIKSQSKNNKKKGGGRRGRNLSSLKVISEETTDVDELLESRPRRIAAMTAVKKNAQIAQMTLISKMRNEESVKKRKLVDSDVQDKEKPRKNPRTEEILVIANVDISEAGAPCSADEKALQLTSTSLKSKQNNKRNKSTLRRETRTRTVSRTLTEDNWPRQNMTSRKSTMGQQLVDNTIGVSSNNERIGSSPVDPAKVQIQIGDLSVAVLASNPEEVAKQNSGEVTTSMVAAQTQNTDTTESGPEREDTEPRLNKPNNTFTLISSEKDEQTSLPSSLIQTSSRQEDGPSSHKEKNRTIFREPEPASKPVPETKVEVRITRSKMRKNAELAKENRRTPEEMTTKIPSSVQSDGNARIVKQKTFLNQRLMKQDNLYNCKDHLKNLFMSSDKKRHLKITPLQIKNGIIKPSSGPTKLPLPAMKPASKGVCSTDIENMRKEEMRKKQLKEQEVVKKKQEIIKTKQEELKKINEEKMLKATQLREAAEKEKNEYHARIEKEREERERLTKAEVEKQKEEVMLKKKLQNQQKAQEVEHRRLKEEAARLARLREMEEEQKQQELLRQKLQEDTERVQKQRQKEEELLRQKELQKMKENQQKLKEKYKQKLQSRKELKDKDNYPIDDVSTDESTDGGEVEDNGKKEIPHWAKREVRQKTLERQVHVPMSLVHSLFQCPSKTPDLTEFFGKMTMKRIRTSSAVWLDSPPIKLAVHTAPGSSYESARTQLRIDFSSTTNVPVFKPEQTSPLEELIPIAKYY